MRQWNPKSTLSRDPEPLRRHLRSGSDLHWTLRYLALIVSPLVLFPKHQNLATMPVPRGAVAVCHYLNVTRTEEHKTQRRD